ncbi:hypothetical protein B0H16DRAFT_1794257 [Mycena metata]|uniref:Isopenicillin N synthase-like Fe(2+) 2OG dioxygenase domain-containing protein n=1 Tax=Mycena metata TaxID=1033252 RepID=A0AAD7HGB2_9AGAR|nr:hypothetical protein B0H16DRAFT_1794257 [Mycena metata]
MCDKHTSVAHGFHDVAFQLYFVRPGNDMPIIPVPSPDLSMEGDKKADPKTGVRGSLALLFSQNVAGLQICTPQGEWKFFKPVPGVITVNSTDVLQFLTKDTAPF